MLMIETKLEFSSKAELIHSFYNTYNGNKIIIGYSHDNKIYFLDENQDRVEKITIYPDDTIVYFEY